MNMQIKQQRVWVVRFNCNDPGNGFYGSNSKTVIAEDMDEVMAKIREKYPDAIFAAISHQGTVDID